MLSATVVALTSALQLVRAREVAAGSVCRAFAVTLNSPNPRAPPQLVQSVRAD